MDALGICGSHARAAVPGLWLEGLGTVVLASMLGRLLIIDGFAGLPTQVRVARLFLTRWCLAMSLGGGVWMLTSIVLSFRTVR